MDWNDLIAEVIEREWPISITPAAEATEIRLADLQATVTRTERRSTEADVVLAKTLQLAREIDPGFG